MVELTDKVLEEIGRKLRENGSKGVIVMNKGDEMAEGTRHGLPIRRSELLIEGLQKYLTSIGYFSAVREDTEELHIIVY